MTQYTLERRIGLGGAVFTLVGYVVGAGIYILPGELAAEVGPGVWVSFLIASIPALFTCVVSAHVSNVFPTSGAMYVATRRTLGDFWGFMLVWTILLAASVGIAFVSYGFADYLSYFVPGLPAKGVAVGVVLFFGIVNLLGVQMTIRVQAVMVVWFVFTLLLFGGGGLIAGDVAQLSPLFPNGGGSVLVAAIPAYFAFSGFAVIAEIGEEIKNPQRNIPLCLAISFTIVLVMYTLVPLGLTAVVPWSELSETNAAVGTAAARFLPGWLAGVVSLSALAAAATSVNAILMAQARDIFALARDHMLPLRFGHVNARTGAPDAAILLLIVIALVCVLFGAQIKDYAILTVLGVMLLQGLASIAVLRLPKAAPAEYAQARFKLAGFWRAFFCGGLLLTSVLFAVVGILDSPRASLVFLGAVALGSVYYVWWRRRVPAPGE